MKKLLLALFVGAIVASCSKKESCSLTEPSELGGVDTVKNLIINSKLEYVSYYPYYYSTVTNMNELHSNFDYNNDGLFDRKDDSLSVVSGKDFTVYLLKKLGIESTRANVHEKVKDDNTIRTLGDYFLENIYSREMFDKFKEIYDGNQFTIEGTYEQWSEYYSNILNMKEMNLNDASLSQYDSFKVNRYDNINFPYPYTRNDGSITYAESYRGLKLVKEDCVYYLKNNRDINQYTDYVIISVKN